MLAVELCTGSGCALAVVSCTVAGCEVLGVVLCTGAGCVSEVELGAEAACGVLETDAVDACAEVGSGAGAVSVALEVGTCAEVVCTVLATLEAGTGPVSEEAGDAVADS